MNKKIFAVMPFVMIGLITGVFTGLTRMGWSIPMGAAGGEHGAIMVGSFLGTLILLERVVVLKKRWLYLFPVISGSSILLFLYGRPETAFLALSIGAAGLVLVYLMLLRLYPEYYFYIMLTGALTWLAGNVMVLHTGSYPRASTWWILFVLLTVTGERLELSKFLPDRPLKSPCFSVWSSLFWPAPFLRHTERAVGFRVWASSHWQPGFSGTTSRVNRSGRKVFTAIPAASCFWPIYGWQLPASCFWPAQSRPSPTMP